MPEPISTGGSAAAVKIYGLASVTIVSIVLVCRAGFWYGCHSTT